MTLFVAIAASMLMGALAFVLWPMLRRTKTVSPVTQTSANAALLREELAALDAELARGAVSTEQHAHARTDIERRVLEEVVAKPDASTVAKPAGKRAVATIAVLVPLAVLLLYLLTGNPGALEPQNAAHGEAAITPEVVEQMVSRLAERLKANPDDAAGWVLLARSYYAMERFPEAVTAFTRAIKMIGNDAGLYADYADALAMTRGGHFDSEVLALVAQALKLDPEHPKALLIASTAAFQRKDYREAAAILERLQQLLPADSQFAALAGERLAQARAHLGVASAAPAATSAAPVAPQAAGPTIRGRVELSAALAGKAAPADTVFILARAPQGSRMPLAILRRQVKDLPFDFTLSDEQAMSPAMKLSAFSEVVVVARVSKSGNAASQSGDLLGSTAAIKVGAAGIKVLIDSSVP